MQCKTANKCFLALQRSVQNIQLQPNQDFITTSYSVFIEGYKSKELHWKRRGQDRTQVSWISSCFWRQPFLSTSDSSCFPLRSILAKTSMQSASSRMWVFANTILLWQFSTTSRGSEDCLAKWNQSKDKDLEPKVSCKKTTRDREETMWRSEIWGRQFFPEDFSSKDGVAGVHHRTGNRQQQQQQEQQQEQILLNCKAYNQIVFHASNLTLRRAEEVESKRSPFLSFLSLQ